MLELRLGHGGKTLVTCTSAYAPPRREGARARGRPGWSSGWVKPAERPPPPSPPAVANPFIKRGYAVAEFDMQELAIDQRDRARTVGVYQLGEKIDCGGLMAWTWGFHRVIDALQTIDRIDAKRVVVTGHSRFGKAGWWPRPSTRSP